MPIAAPKSTPLLINGRVSEPWLAFFASLAGGGFTASQVQANDVVMSFPANLNPIGTGSGQLQILALSQAAIDLWNTSPGAVTPAGGSHWRIFADDLGGGGGVIVFGFYDVPKNLVRGGFDDAGTFYALQGLNIGNAANVSFGSNYQNWTPALSASGAMTISGLSIQESKYLRIGPLVHFTLTATFNLGGAASTTIFITLPVPAVVAAGAVSPVSASVYMPGVVANEVAGGYVSGTLLTVTRSGAPNFPVITGVQLSAAGVYRAA